MPSFPRIEENASSLSDDDAGDSKGRRDSVETSISSSHRFDESGRDEVHEIQKMSRTETQLIQTWRGVLLFMLVITAAAVSSITFALLSKKENAAYRATVCTFPHRKSAVENHSSHSPFESLHSLKNSRKLSAMPPKRTT